MSLEAGHSVKLCHRPSVCTCSLAPKARTRWVSRPWGLATRVARLLCANQSCRRKNEGHCTQTCRHYPCCWLQSAVGWGFSVCGGGEGAEGLPSATIMTIRRRTLSGDVAQLVERPTGTPPLRQVRFPGAARDFSARVNFQCRLSYCLRWPPCVTACINICAHVKDPLVHVEVRWITEPLKTPCIRRSLGSATLSPLAFSREKQPEFPVGEIPTGQYSYKDKKYYIKIKKKPSRTL